MPEDLTSRRFDRPYRSLQSSFAIAFVTLGAACSAVSSRPNVVAPIDRTDQRDADVTAPSPRSASAEPSAPAPATPGHERGALVAWLKEGLPEGGEIVDVADKPVGLAHIVRRGDSLASIADAYVGLTEIYLARDLGRALQTENARLRSAAPRTGDRVVIPSVLQRAPRSADEERIGWPEDKQLRGLYVRGATAGGSLYIGLLDRMAKRDLNLIVLDAKDYDGWVTYRSKVPLVIETGASKGAPVRDMARTVRFAHARGIRVAMRVSCFEDEFMAKAKPELVPLSIWKRPYPIGWLDPANEAARAYIFALVKEALDFGVDEIQLDYVRYPVLGVKNADFDLTKGKTPKPIIIRDFVRKVHELTSARKVPLSLDIFGIVADGQRSDIESLGQDPALLAPECEVLSPMVYPSHYSAGYLGFEIPGNHPEIVGFATKKILAQLEKAKTAVLIRPWLQAVAWNSPEYGPQYVAAEIKSAEGAGSKGWLMWNPAQTYTVTWTAVPPVASGSSRGSSTAASQ